MNCRPLVSPGPLVTAGADHRTSQRPLEPRRPGWPTNIHPDDVAKIAQVIWGEFSLRAICRMPGMPSREAVYAWRRAAPNFDRSCRFMAQEGRINLVELVSEEFDRLMEQGRGRLLRGASSISPATTCQGQSTIFGGP